MSLFDWISFHLYTYWHWLTCVVCKPRSRVSLFNTRQRGDMFDGILLMLGATLIVGLLIFFLTDMVTN